MNLTDIKVYTLNLSAMTITTFDVLEDGLTLLLLVVSIGYTLQKWYEIRRKKNKKKMIDCPFASTAVYAKIF